MSSGTCSLETTARFLSFSLQLGQLALDAAVFFLGEVVLGVLGEVAEGGGLADALLDVELKLEQLFPLPLHRGLFRGTDDLHDKLLNAVGRQQRRPA